MVLYYAAHRLRIRAVSATRQACLQTGEFLKRLGRKFVATGRAEDPRWDVSLLQKCGNQVYVELNYRAHVRCGPLYSVYREDGNLVLRCNWVATRRGMSWEYEGTQDVVVQRVGAPHILPNGDRMFMFAGGGWGVLHFDPAYQGRAFAGDADAEREYTYF